MSRTGRPSYRLAVAVAMIRATSAGEGSKAACWAWFCSGPKGGPADGGGCCMSAPQLMAQTHSSVDRSPRTSALACPFKSLPCPKIDELCEPKRAHEVTEFERLFCAADCPIGMKRLF